MVARNMINASDISLLVDEVREVMINNGYAEISVIGKSQSIVQFFSTWTANYDAKVLRADFDGDDNDLYDIWIKYHAESDTETIDIVPLFDDTADAVNAVFLFDDIPSKIQFAVERTKKPFYVLGIMEDFSDDDIPDVLQDGECIPFEYDNKYDCSLCNKLDIGKAYVAYYDDTPVEGIDVDELFEAFKDVYTLVKRSEDVLVRVYDLFGDDFWW